MPVDGGWHAISRDYLLERAARGDSRAARIVRGVLLDERKIGEQLQAVTSSSETPFARVAVGVCTARRPSMLKHCLEAMARQIVPDTVELHLVVVDNEAEPNNQRLVQQFAGRCPFPVHYAHEPARGIPQARNAAVEVCQRLGADWIAFTDDDCWVSPIWVVSLLDAAHQHKADVVYGRRELLLPSTYWALPPEQSKFAEGERLRSAATHNVLFAGRLVAEIGDNLRFDDHLAHGEDTDFFYRASLRGARIVYSHTPIVFEVVPPERATLRQQSSRAYYYAASRSYFYRRHRGVPRALWGVLDRLILKGPAAVARLGVAPLVWLFDEKAFRSLVIKGTARLAGIAGATAGFLGRPGNPYGATE